MAFRSSSAARSLIGAAGILSLALGVAAGAVTPSASNVPTPSPNDPMERLMEALRSGDVAAVELLAAEGKRAGAKGLALRLAAGNGFFNLGEPERALQEHRAASQDPEQGGEARLETAIDLMVLRRYDQMCEAIAEISRGAQKGGGGMGSPAMYAYSLLRCGRPADALELLQNVYRSGHSSAEEALAQIFGQLQRFQRYEHDLAARAGKGSAELVAKRARGELYLCGDYANPWGPELYHRKAAEQFRAASGAEANRCALAGRIAVAEILDAENRKRASLSANDLASAETALGPHLREPGCAEAAEAAAIYRKDARPKDQAERVRFLETATTKFPSDRGLRDLLLDEYRSQGAEAAKRAALEEAVRAFPDDPYPFFRLAMVEMRDPGRSAEAIAWLRKGLAIRPDSMQLNLGLAVALLKGKEFTQAVAPASRYLAGLLETRTYHHDWDRGMALLSSALNRKSPWSDAPEKAAEEWKDFLASGGPHDDFFQSGHGCFTPAAGVVLEVPAWFRPDLVRTAAPSPAEKAQPTKP